MNLKFEPMAKEHASVVMEIFNYYIEHSLAAYPEAPLPEAAFNLFLEKTRGYPAYVIVNTETAKPLGFCFLHAYSPFSTFKHTAEVTYFLAPDFVGKRLGSVVLEKLEQDGRKIGITRLLASVSSENAQSLAFHIKSGFKECGRLHQIGNKLGQSFDVVWMEKSIA
jgi:L-amino acid N-acyltransferase YncA